MKTFVVAITDMFENDMVLEKIEADSKEKAMVECLKRHWGAEDFPSDFPVDGDIEDMKDYAINCDMIVDMIEV